jgi:hypothetical protein
MRAVSTPARYADDIGSVTLTAQQVGAHRTGRSRSGRTCSCRPRASAYRRTGGEITLPGPTRPGSDSRRSPRRPAARRGAGQRRSMCASAARDPLPRRRAQFGQRTAPSWKRTGLSRASLAARSTFGMASIASSSPSWMTGIAPAMPRAHGSALHPVSPSSSLPLRRNADRVACQTVVPRRAVSASSRLSGWLGETQAARLLAGLSAGRASAGQAQRAAPAASTRWCAGFCVLKDLSASPARSPQALASGRSGRRSTCRTRWPAAPD